MAMCLRCEVTRAKVLSNGLLIVGTPRSDIVNRLNRWLSPEYYLEGNAIMRRNNPTNIVIVS